jgi:membrane-associated PAP2 superfamily phosphatase
MSPEIAEAAGPAPATSGSVPYSWFVVVLAIAAVLGTLPFWLTEADIAAAALFFDPVHPEGPWPLGAQSPWTWLYDVVPVLTTLLGLGSLAAIGLGARRSGDRTLLRAGLVVFLTLGLGPGLLVNALFKDHWGRPRPKQLVEFNGHWSYLPPLAKGIAGSGKAFPSGHASVGFALASLALVAWRRHRRTAVALLAGSLTAGGAIGLARMAAGGHFLSDVIWAGVISVSTAVVLHRVFFGGPVTNPWLRALVDRIRPVRWLLTAGVVLAIIGFVLLASPIYKRVSWSSTGLDVSGPYAVEVEIDRADVRLLLVDGHDPALAVEGEIRGFGLPSGEVRRSHELVAGDPQRVRYTLTTVGAVTDYDAILEIRVTTDELAWLEFELGRGDCTVIVDGDPTALPPLDVHLGDGDLVAPAGVLR